MLEVDLQAPDQEVGMAISQTCSRYGRVTSVKVHRTPSTFALVEMTNREQTSELAANFGGSTFGNCALIHLHQKTG